MTPTLRLILTNEFGDQTDITKTLPDSSMDQIYVAIREALAGCGFSAETIDLFFPMV
jgi:hypothetical protein